MKHAIISGATGFIGQALCRTLRDGNWRVTGLARRAPAQPLAGVRYASFDLDQEILPETTAAIGNADVLIHLAYVAGEPRPLERNVEGTKRLLQAADLAGIRKRIFISSFSASAEAVAAYGRQKFRIEQLFTREGDISLRLGLVLGRGGGLFDKTLQLLEKLPVIPLIDGGRQPVQVIRVADLTRIIEYAAQNPVPALLHIGSADALTIRQLYELLAQKLGLKKIFLPVPLFCVYPLAWLAGKAGIRLPITTDNLEGLRSARVIDVTADLLAFPFAIPDAVSALQSQEL